MRHIKNILFILAILTLGVDVYAQTGRRTGRSNSDQCCPTSILVEGAGGKTKELKVDLFSDGKPNGPVEVYATDKNGKPIDVSKAITFSKDDKILKIKTSMFCPPMCDDDDIILEFRTSSKSDMIKISNLKSWPPYRTKFVLAKSPH